MSAQQKSFRKCSWELPSIDDVFSAQTLVPCVPFTPRLQCTNTGSLCSFHTTSIFDEASQQRKEPVICTSDVIDVHHFLFNKMYVRNFQIFSNINTLLLSCLLRSIYLLYLNNYSIFPHYPCLYSLVAHTTNHPRDWQHHHPQERQHLRRRQHRGEEGQTKAFLRVTLLLEGRSKCHHTEEGHGK